MNYGNLFIDHIVLAVGDPAATARFYSETLGMEAVEMPGGKWVLKFGNQQINLQPADSLPSIAENTARGGANFCLLTETPLDQFVNHLKGKDVDIIEGPGHREGAAGALLSVYFYDPDGNLVEISNRI